MFRFLPFYRSVVVEDVAGSHKLVRDLALQSIVRGLMGERAGGIHWVDLINQLNKRSAAG